MPHIKKQNKLRSPFSLLRCTGTSLLMLLLSSSVDSLRTSVGSFWASQSATLHSEAIMAACSVLRSLPLTPAPPAPLFLERGRWWSGVNFDTWSLMVTFPGDVSSNSMVKEAWPWAVEGNFYTTSLSVEFTNVFKPVITTLGKSTIYSKLLC